MLTKIFQRKFLHKCRVNMVTCLSIIKYLFAFIGMTGSILLATGINAPDPYGRNSLLGCAICIALVFISMIIELFVVNILVRDNEHIKCLFDFDCYGLKSLDNWKEYKRGTR